MWAYKIRKEAGGVLTKALFQVKGNFCILYKALTWALLRNVIF